MTVRTVDQQLLAPQTPLPSEESEQTSCWKGCLKTTLLALALIALIALVFLIITSHPLILKLSLDIAKVVLIATAKMLMIVIPLLK